ncbi:Kelch repeat-containing protein [Maribacter polysaccharolyticus]|uniref:Kelch repeat-containing protein n=1 Tax=Maribacter polysaccharolyticus TaxID=3020831 RepID=UPI00237FB471|nr:kelch repeat-containing protein [Maribacter polysaccharolyticus]MDE3741143.1 kelch repeat-containing protein [Maribacter polysaccharolyticus]
MKQRLDRSLVILLMIGFLSLTFSCSSDDDDDDLGNWTKRSSFNEEPRSNAVAFSVGNNGYMGTGYDGDDYLGDFWKYDFDIDAWQQLADYPGMVRSSAVSFTIGNEGFVGAGYNGDINEELSDFYKYDTGSNTWIPIADYGGGPRRGAVGFSSNSHGYVGTGYDGDGDKKDFWKYDPATDTWTELLGFGGDKRREAATFKIDDKVYLCTGVNNGVYVKDFWVFDVNTEQWSSFKNLDHDDYDDDYLDIMRASAVGFSMAGRGYIACGERPGAMKTIWEYRPENNSWEQKLSFERNARQDAISFGNGERAFVSLGRNGTLYLDDTMEFFPFEWEDEDDN